MVKLFRRIQKQVALSPGTVVYHGPRKTDRMRVSTIEYGPDFFEEQKDVKLDDAMARLGSERMVWINIDGLHETDLLSQLGNQVNIHLLVLEDIVNVTQRPKVEDYEDYMYIVLRMILWDEEEDNILTEQVSLILGNRFVISFQEVEGDVFDPVRERIRKGGTRVRRLGSDYLADILLDAIVDNYMVVLEKINERVEALEEPVTQNPTPEMLEEIHQLKRDVIYLRKRISPVRELLDRMIRSDSDLITESVQPFLRDVYDHTIHVVDSVETFRDILSGLQDLYLSSVGNRMNEVMKVLTIIATIFIPLTFLAGIYGMNFEVIPELKWKWGYLAFWMVIVAMGSVMVAFFRRKKWL